ncbi:vacuolar protein sorting 13D isoform X3 [Rhodnius prolixus]|uniref:vacuolar protein sorting 13D isoform X3 n=1 Tax=Rhodnius prolixus TaxID=13249 RepID=UPI003D18AF46
MLEGLVAWVINNYLGKYVENLNTDQLSIGLLQGAVELENLPLKKDSLRQIGLPVEVRAGLIGKVKLKIPVSQITSAPWEIYMDQLYIVVGPVRLTELSEEAEEQAVLDYKLSRLDAIETGWRSETETSQDTSYYASSYSSWLGLSMNFAANIIENLQLKIKDVHIRYEDNMTIAGKTFAAGIQMESLSAQSCNALWNPCFISCSTGTESYKLMEMSGFAIYWDSIQTDSLWGDLPSQELSVAMSCRNTHEYLLSPVNAQAHVKRNRSELPLRSKTNPRIICDLTLDQVPLSLTERQYHEMVGCRRGLILLQRRQGHLRERPKTSIKETPQLWWKYACSRFVKPSITWEMALSRARDNVAYVSLYSKLLITPTTVLKEEEKLFKDLFESSREFEDLFALRQVAMSRTRRPECQVNGKRQQGVSVLASWFPHWWGWHSSQTEKTPTSSSNALEEQILDALADSIENNTLLKRDTIFGHFNFTLKQGAFNLCSSTKEPLMELQFENVRLSYESRPRSGSHSISVTLGALYLRDHLFKDSAFPVLISPQKSDSAPSSIQGKNLPAGLARLLSHNVSTTRDQPLFQLSYEYKPLNCSADRRLEIKSKSLDIVYNPGATKWILDFFTGPHQVKDSGLRQAARKSYHAMKRKTKQHLLSNWESLVHGHSTNKKSWDLELDISAPQIFLVEHFNDKNAILCVIDFGKLYFTNRNTDPSLVSQGPKSETVEEEEDEEAFQTPCSTPPGSEASSLASSRNQSVDITNLNELILHNKLYERYSIELSDLQILVGCVRDNWKYAHLRGTSSLHILDKFSISLQMERRVVHTIDPQFPSLTLTGNLPKLVAHINEEKVKAVRSLVAVISGRGLISPLRSQETTPNDELFGTLTEEEIALEDSDLDTGAKLLMLQFSVDQMALEVQSRGRSVAELQVSGVKMGFTKRPFDTSISLSVHGLLLVDALQTFGPDFELLIASHKHVGMDSVSGILQDSEPTSPTSPSSPDPDKTIKLPTSPLAISQAISSLSANRAKSPSGVTAPSQVKLPVPNAIEMVDTEALISLELIFVSADCPTNDEKKEHLQIANIQFNNLDIIANQETIVELVGFVHRVFPKQKPIAHVVPVPPPTGTAECSDYSNSDESNSISTPITTRTQVTFDFHRLNVLLLRAVATEAGVIGRKIATATMIEAKIHANIGSSLEIEGSVGGLQVLDLTPDGRTHQRILSLGIDPLTEAGPKEVNLAYISSDMYSMSGYPTVPPPVSSNQQAFSLQLKRTSLNHDTDIAEISVRMASVWYIHSPHLLVELNSCAAEFKQYLSNLVASIKSAATEVAIGIVHARAEALAQSLSMGSRLYGSSSDISQTPRKRRSLSQSIDHLDSNRGSLTPRSPVESEWNTIIKWDIVLASPVVVIPRSKMSTQCVVGHLGSITAKNSYPSAAFPWDSSPYLTQNYDVNISSINLYTVDIKQRLRTTASSSGDPCLMRAEELYSSSSDGKPILHNTSIQLAVFRETGHVKTKEDDKLILDASLSELPQVEQFETLKVKGSVINEVKFSLSRAQYEQLLTTLDTCLETGTAPAEPSDRFPITRDENTISCLENILEEPLEMNTGVSTLSMDPAVRARMMVAHSATHRIALNTQQSQTISFIVNFELPLLTLELTADLGAGEQKFVELSFKELLVQYEKSHEMEINAHVSLHSVVMEDLQKPADSKHRYIMVSSNCNDGASDVIPLNFVSRSMPDLSSSARGQTSLPWHSSLPDHLETGKILGAVTNVTRHHHIVAAENSVENRMRGDPPKCPYTPPPSPRGKVSPSVFNEDNLVHVNIVMKPSRHPTQNNTKHVTVDFNSLDLIVNVESWVVVLDFFGISDIDQNTFGNRLEEPMTPTATTNYAESQSAVGLDSELEITVKSLSVVLNRAEYEVAKAVMSTLNAKLVSLGGSLTTRTEASVGTFMLADLTPSHSALYRERFITAGLQLDMTKYNPTGTSEIVDCDFNIKLNMTSLVYVHTQRYVSEIQAFFNLFPYLRREVGYFRGSLLESEENALSTRILLEIHAPSPIIILPMSSQSTSVLLANLGNLKVKNSLCMSDHESVISKSSDSLKEVLLDVMKIELESMDIATGERVTDISAPIENYVAVGSYYIKRKGPSLLKEKCHLSLQVERNLMSSFHCVPDLSIHGKLSTLAATLPLEDYKLISGLLSFNIGECLDDLQMPTTLIEIINVKEENDFVWTRTYMKLELVDVSVCLVPTEFYELACINFIKSSLTVDNFSNRTQDIDLVSQEILITDIRYQDQPANKRSNVFTNILQPIHQITGTDSVQAQVHHRMNVDSSKFTILLNNMRLMAILDWWELVRDFIMTKPDSVQPTVLSPAPVPPAHLQHSNKENTELPFELKLNITDSEIVVLQDTSQWDTNAVILKSTTVITYRPLEVQKPISFNLNHCEMFSCILGMEDETALSIIDPVTVNMDITRKYDAEEGTDIKLLRVHMAHLSLRLSYHDVRMFSQMLDSLPQQTQSARSRVAETHPVNLRNQLEKLKALGFRTEDCSEALSNCNGNLDDAALWLTQHAIIINNFSPSNVPPAMSPVNHIFDSPFSFQKLEVETDSVGLCVIDDCRDADVPLVEFLFNKLELKKNLIKKSGFSQTTISVHYYNRFLSGWEPFIEPWSCTICWEQSANKTRLDLSVSSTNSLNLNITSSLIELYRSVKEIWTQDYYSPKEITTGRDDSSNLKILSSPPGYRRRSPFVPFALRNDTGSTLYFTTIISTEEKLMERQRKLPDHDLIWNTVEPFATVPFSFIERGKVRHRDTHKLRSHQLGIRVEGWNPITPVTVDRVGIYFRQAFPDMTSMAEGMPQARIVLEVTLEGSARKLVTVRSALQIANQLDNTVEIKLDNKHLRKGIPMHLTVKGGEILSVPLSHAMAQMWARPLDTSGTHKFYTFSNKSINWQHVTQSGQLKHEMRQCNTNSGFPFRFCASIQRENYPPERHAPVEHPLNMAMIQPAHTINLLPPLTIINLLPYELFYTIKDPNVVKSVIKPGQHFSNYSVDLENTLELTFNLENFRTGGTLQIPGFSNSYTTRVILHDNEKRRLYLNAVVHSYPGVHVKVTMYAPFWLVNKTAIPLVFKQEGVSLDTAGQYEEHEVARMVAPLLFSFADNDSSPTVTARVGMKVHDDGVPLPCRAFTLQPGVLVRELKVSLRDNRPDLVYMIGIEVRQGRGRYSMTKIVTLTARYQIHNKSSYRLQFAQKCFASTVSDPGAQATYLTAVPNCSLPFHWPRLDKDQLLCLRILDVPQCHWSGGFKLVGNSSFHLNIRNPNGSMHFLRIEIVLQGATHFIVLTDADTMPPPIRIDNLSHVSIKFHQLGLDSLACNVPPQSSVPYAWDEPILDNLLTVIAPGGVSASYNLRVLGEAQGLTYENFIYIAFTGTFKNCTGNTDLLDVECQQLVLDVPDPCTGKVVLSKKEQGARSQLWRMTADGQLQHEGSAPPRARSDKIMVLDICGPAPQPTQYVGLTLRRPDSRRASTQSWRFTDEGRLCCVHNSMCVQAKDGFYGLHKGSEAVLGPAQPVTYQTTDSGLPLEQAVSRQRLRPGSGFLSVMIETDGPTRVLKVIDIKEKRRLHQISEGGWYNVSCNLPTRSQKEENESYQEIQVNINLPCIGVSLISRNPPEELLFARLSDLRFSTLITPAAEILDICIQDIQVDNQVFEAQCPVVLFVSPISRTSDPDEAARPALSITAERTPTKHSYNADIFRHLIISIKNMSLIIDERLLLKLYLFTRWNNSEENENADESDFETQRILAEAASVHAKRYYFSTLEIIFTQVRLSVMTSNKLSDRLIAVKKKLGLTLIRFEDAAVELEIFKKEHAFESSQFLINAIWKHYKDELKWQAGIILGSVDFLGNPIGFVNDLSEGVSGLIYDGNVKALVKNVAHGLSNSAAKVTESLGDGIGRVVFDDTHEERRQKIRAVKSGSSSDHLMAGLKGFGFGLLGGVTSVFKQTYDGYTNDGIQGTISGLAKGLVGTVTKPVVGVLDLASETASAVRDSSRSSSKQIPTRKRLPRCVTSPTGFLPPYNKKQSEGQHFLYIINNRNYSELFMAYEVLRSGSEDLRIVISSESVRVFSCGPSSSGTAIVFAPLDDLKHCAALTMTDSNGDLMYYVELTVKVDQVGVIQGGLESIARPRIRCDTENIAAWVSHQVNYAKSRFVERQHTLFSPSDILG